MKQFSLTDHAAFVHEWCNLDFFAHLLNTIETSARELGLEIGPAERAAYEQSEFLTMAAAVNQARRMYLAPTINPELAARILANDIEDGYAQMWLKSILSALQDRGIYLHRPVRHEATPAVNGEISPLDVSNGSAIRSWRRSESNADGITVDR